MKPTLITDLTYLPAAPAVAIPTLSPTVVAAPWRRRWLNGRRAVRELAILVRLLRKPAKIKAGLQQAERLRAAYYGPLRGQKVARVAGRYYHEFFSPGWPSAAHSAYLATTLNRLVPFRVGPAAVDMVFLAITKKCPLACEHCFEWDALNQKERLSLADLRAMVANFQQLGATQIFLSGGEPMLRLPDILKLLRLAQPGTDFWVLTSGFHFTQANAHQLRQAGLTGVSISLDHHEPDRHNAFRGSATAYAQAIRAATYAHAAGLVVALTVCATQAFTTEENLLAYAALAKQLGVTFVHILEPREVGHYAGQQVDLSAAQLRLLDEFYEKFNYGPDYLDWPIVHYYGYHQRRLGCHGAANRFLYVDTDGDLHACPFCQKKSGSALPGQLPDSLAQVRQLGCQQFCPAPL